MGKFENFIYHVMIGEEESSLRKVALAPLSLLSFFYGLVLKIRRFLFHCRIFQIRSLPCKVISVGNITLGGTGKTPFVCLLTKLVQEKGCTAAVLSRGYKGSFRGAVGVVSDGQEILMSSREAGDEPLLLAEILSGVPVLIGRERWRPGRYAVERFHSQVVILDDGFQHLAMKRDLNLLLIDSASPFGNGHLFPRGSLREPVDQVSRADAIVLTKGGNFDNIKKLKRKLQSATEGLPVFRVDYMPMAIRVAGEDKTLSTEALERRKILAFAAIARPESFRRTLLGLNARIIHFESFPDHHFYDSGDIERLCRKGRELGVEAIVTTEKDEVRLRNIPRIPLPLWVLTVRHAFLENDQERFEEFLWKHLNRPL